MPNTISTEANAGVTSENTSADGDLTLTNRRGELIDIGLTQLRVYRAGTGGPTVVICAGAGDCASSWTSVVSVLAHECRVISYDRPGIGGSPACSTAPGLDRYLHELGAVLAHVREDEPVVLLGHSLGGLIARTYAERHPDQVAGLVLVDPTPDAIADQPGARAGFWIAALLGTTLKPLARFGLVRALLAARAMPFYPEQPHYRAAVRPDAYQRWITDVCCSFAGAAGQELRSVITAARSARRQADALTVLGDIPVVMLTSRAYGKRWIDMHRELALATGARTHRITDDRSHNIHLRHPALVAAETARVLLAATSRT